jgi:hypothetical protein
MYTLLYFIVLLTQHSKQTHIYRFTSSTLLLMASATASTMGSIIAVVAVLEIHMDRNMVVNMKPSISRAWLVPTYETRYYIYT